MGLITSLVTPTLFTIVTLGALKRVGAIDLKPSNIKNDTLRVIFVKSVAAGEAIFISAEELWKSLPSK